MYGRSDIADLLKLVENGNIKLGKAGAFEESKIFPLEQWKEAWDVAAEDAGFGRKVLLDLS